MLRELGLNLIVVVSAALLCFTGGLIFAEPLKRWVDQRRRLSHLTKQKPIAVRIFPILFPFPLDDLKRLLLRENQNRLTDKEFTDKESIRAWAVRPQSS
jgi:hypothetical protein